MLPRRMPSQIKATLRARKSGLRQLDEFVRRNGTSGFGHNLASSHVLFQLALILLGILIAQMIGKRMFWSWIQASGKIGAYGGAVRISNDSLFDLSIALFTASQVGC